MYYHVRRLETVNVGLIDAGHPMFAGAGFEFWRPRGDGKGDPIAEGFGRASFEGAT